jgi:hexosaminidase
MKFFLILIIVLSVSCCSSQKNNTGIIIIPKPESVLENDGFCRLDYKSTICGSGISSSLIIDVFSDQVKEYLSLESVKSGESDIEIIIEPGKKAEGYALVVKKSKIFVTASTLNGAFNGLQSLRQLIIFSEKGNGKLFIPCCLINDTPCYIWRGIMLDESRHFFGIIKVKQLLDMMALHKLNIFHWHLTDCAGWRLEIKKYPKLTAVGGIGNHSDPDAPATYYTQEQVREIVKYAADRFIKIIPEIDMPGHAAASNRAYPEFSGGGSAAYPEFTFNPGTEGTYSYLTDILTEVTALFPSQYIHLGGDEVHFGNEKWNTINKVKNMMKKNNLPDLKAVEKYFVKRMADTIRSMNRTTVGWDEIVDIKLNPKDAVVMWWRHNKPEQLDSAFKKNYRVVLCPRIPLYFDFVQYTTHKWGRRWNGTYAGLENVYNFPADSLFRLKEYNNQVLGIQANLWSEVIQNDKRLDFMTYPRLSAMAEAAWTKRDIKNYSSFMIRLKPMLKYLKEKGIYYFDPFNPELNPEPSGPEILN